MTWTGPRRNQPSASAATGLPLVVLVVALGAGVAAGQDVGLSPAFDATSVKPNRDGGPAIGSLFTSTGNPAMTNFSLRMLVGVAMGFDLSQAHTRIVGLPAWADADTFDVRASVAGTPSNAQRRLMLLALLADRFQLQIHRESRSLPVFSLVRVNPVDLGPQLRPHNDGESCNAAPASGPPASPPAAPAPVPTAEAAARALREAPCGVITGGILLDRRDLAWAGGRRVTMEMVARGLGMLTPMERPVQNGTNLEGFYDFVLWWNPQIPDLSTTVVDVPGLSFLQALSEHTGLKVVPAVGPVDVVVVDRVARPSPD